MPENNKKQCPHNCLKCTIMQQIYCTSQNAHDIAIMLREFHDAFLGGANEIIKNTDGDGVKNRAPNEQPQNNNVQ